MDINQTLSPKTQALAQLRTTGIYLLFDPRQHPTTWLTILTQCAQIGIVWFQLRAKGATFAQIKQWVQHFRKQLPQCMLIINDRPDWAVKLHANGAHIGPKDGSIAQAAAKLRPKKLLLGCSARTQEQIAQAVDVDYFGVGPYNTTTTKTDTGPALQPITIKKLIHQTTTPCVAIGGITPTDLAPIYQLGFLGVAIYSGIWQQDNPLVAAQRYLAAWQAAR